MQPLAFCNLAARLIENEKNPEGFRTAISRAYYGAFLEAEAFLGRMSVYLVSANPHLELVRILAATGDAEVDEAGAMLADLREERNRADYKLNQSEVEEEDKAQQCLDDALHIIGRLNTCRTSPTRFPTVTATIRAGVDRLRGIR